MHICITGYSIDPEAGSEAGMAWHWIRLSIENGQTVTVITDPDSQSRIEKTCNETALALPSIFPVPRRFNFLLSLKEPGMYIQYMVWQRDAGRLVRDLKSIDLGHHTSWGNLGLGTAFRNAGIPYIFGPYGGGTNAQPAAKIWLGRSWTYELIRSWMASTLTKRRGSRLDVQNATLNLATNEATKTLASRMGAKDCELMLAEGIHEDEIFVREKMPDKATALWVGRLMPRKGVLLALHAFARTLQKVPDATLVIVGDGPEYRSAQFLVAALGLEDKVLLLGRIPWADVQSMYVQAKCLLFSSLRDSSGAQVLEAAAKGTPIVAFSESGVSEWLSTPAGNFADFSENVDLVDSLSLALTNSLTMSSTEWMESSRSANDYAREHSWPNKYTQMKRLLEIRGLKLSP